MGRPGGSFFIGTVRRMGAGVGVPPYEGCGRSGRERIPNTNMSAPLPNTKIKFTYPPMRELIPKWNGFPKMKMI